MSISKRNSEGYYDPTAYKALTEIAKTERRAMGGSPSLTKNNLVYICSPYRGDATANVANAQRYCRLAADSGKIPIAPHLYLPQFLDDNNAVERKAGLELGLYALRLCSEVWVFGSTISQGMQCELAEAKRRKMTIRYLESEEVASC